MIIDSSAIIAILQLEPERHAFYRAIEEADSVRMSVATFVECSIVAESRGRDGLRDLDHLIAISGIELVPVDTEQAQIARSAFSRFGKGHHRAALNFGDCFAYAAAIAFGEPLLCKGNYFIHTDVPIFDVG